MPNNLPSQPAFPLVRRGGLDPQAVESHIVALHRTMEERIAAAEATYANLETELGEARKREEAVHLTLIAATKTKEELLVNAQRDADEIRSSSQAAADELLGEAKKEAFRMMADARTASEETAELARARADEIASKAQAVAEATRDAARREAMEMINSVETDTASLIAAQEGALAEMRRQYEEEEAELAARIAVLRATATDIESRLQAIASGSLSQATSLVSQAPAAAPISEPAPAPRPVVQSDLNASAVTAESSSRASDTASSVAEVMSSEISELAEEPAPAFSDAAAPDVHVPSEVAYEPVDHLESVDHVEPVAVEPTLPAEELAPIVDDTIEEAPATEGNPEPAPQSAEQTYEEAEVVPAVAETYVEPSQNIHEDELPPTPVEEVAEAVEEAYEAPVPREREPVGVGARADTSSDESNRKGSYYSRRSAKLPRIGNEAGRSALAAAQAIRGATRGTAPKDPDVGARTA